MKIVLLLIFVFFTIPAFAQDYEYGKPAELKGLKKIIIDTGTDLDNHNRIAKEIEKSNLGLEIVESEKDAEIWLVFRVGTTSGGVTANTVGNVTTAQEDIMESGRGGVLVQARDPNKIRIVYEFKDVRKGLIEKRPATNFAKNFLKEYKKANDIK